MMREGKAAAKRLALETLGWVLILAGIAALVLPGPGLLGIFAGLVLLSQQYEWAERRVEPVKEKALQAAAESVATWPRILTSLLAALVLIGAGAVWIWQPPAPGWWKLNDDWWLLGGWATGVTQVASGLIAVAMIIYSYQRFRSPDSADS